MNKHFILPIISVIVIIGIGPQGVFADMLGERHNFFVNPTYDVSGRSTVPATLTYVSEHAYFYVDDLYLNNLSPFERRIFDQRLITAGQDFDATIYPNNTAFWGSEPNPGIDNDPRLTIFLERLNTGTGGYFDSVNNYPLSQTTNTNQREMIVANVLSLANDHFKVFAAHELQHLISFNQKELLRDVSEDTWLNELRSQYAVTLAGYNDDFQNSDLMQRAFIFLQNPTDSLAEWPNTNIDYASVTLFGHYLAGRFGPNILKETLQSPLAGITSINKWLADNHQSERFGEVFADWVWANYTQSLNPRFRYANPNLQTTHVPLTDSRQLTASSQNTFTYNLKPWQPNWNQFILDPSTPVGKNIKISWHNTQFQVFYSDANIDARALNDGDVIALPSAGSSFILMPVNETKTENFGTSEMTTPLALSIEYTNQPITGTAVHDGSLIMHAGTPDIYVVWGPYKRYLAPDVLKFYGLDAAQAVTVSEAVFQSYMPSNYIRDVSEKKVYAVWPDGTKHWLNMTAQHFTDSHRDWNSVFIVNSLESNFYKIGPAITN